MKSHIFRKYDIRGIFKTDFDARGAEKIGAAFATFLKKKLQKSNLKIAVGRDGRIHSQKIFENFARGAAKCGAQIHEIGAVPTPLLNFAVCENKFDGGAQITASHNPREYNGFKLCGPNAHAIFDREIFEIGEIAAAENFNFSDEICEIVREDFYEKWNFKIAELCEIEKIKIAIDCGNGICGAFVKKFFEKLNCEVCELFCEVDGNFPNHEADPERPENLKDLQKFVVENSCKLGFAFDGDGDRVGVVDENGEIFGADFLLILFARYFLEKSRGAKIVYNLTATANLKNEILKNGGTPIESQTGHSFIENKMRANDAIFGGETSGHFFFAENYFGFDDAFLAAAKIIEILQKSGKNLNEHFVNLPRLFAGDEKKIPISENEKFSKIEKIQKFCVEKFGAKKVSTIDGVKILFDEKSWAVVRASNTSPFLTARAESDSREKLAKIENEILKIVREI